MAMGRATNNATMIRTLFWDDNFRALVFLVFLDRVSGLVLIIVLPDQDAVELAVGDAMLIT
jgi:hypothetical protein